MPTTLSLLLPCADADKSIKSAVFFPLECSVDLDTIRTAEGCLAGSKSPDTVAALEGLATEWCHMVEQILAESGQMRREADDTGPLAELEYWKLRTARFTGLIEQIKAHPMRSVFMTLHLAKSKVMKVCARLSPNCQHYAVQCICIQVVLVLVVCVQWLGNVCSVTHWD